MRDVRDVAVRRWRTAATECIAALSFAAICIAMLLTVGDILARLVSRTAALITGTNPGWGLFGLVDLTQLAMMTAAPLAIAAAFFAGAHIRVDLVFHQLSAGSRRSVVRLSALIGAAVMGVCLFTAWNEMRGQLEFTTTSATLGIAYTWYWLPLIAGLALSVLGCAILFVWPSDGAESDA